MIPTWLQPPRFTPRRREYTSERDYDNPFSGYADPNARIWSIYLKEAKAVDDDTARIWKTQLNSVLIFVS